MFSEQIFQVTRFLFLAYIAGIGLCRGRLARAEMSARTIGSTENQIKIESERS